MDYPEVITDNNFMFDYQHDYEYLQEIATTGDATALAVYNNYQLTKLSAWSCVIGSTLFIVAGFRFVKGLLT